MVASALQGEVNIEIFGESRDLPEMNRDLLNKYTKEFFMKNSTWGDISSIDVYFKRFEASYLGKPLVFCNVTLNTMHGIVSEHGSAWGVKSALKQAMKNSIIKIEKLAEEKVFGMYGGIEALA